MAHCCAKTSAHPTTRTPSSTNASRTACFFPTLPPGHGIRPKKQPRTRCAHPAHRLQRRVHRRQRDRENFAGQHLWQGRRQDSRRFDCARHRAHCLRAHRRTGKIFLSSPTMHARNEPVSRHPERGCSLTRRLQS